ncbi:MAG TPA: hypothetical protein DCS93_35180 [Microscillaceae bacterium]|nr:hypothetical protein [Microscillaceae bacterium]
MKLCTNTRTTQAFIFIQFLLIGVFIAQSQPSFAQVPTTHYWKLYAELYPGGDPTNGRLNGALAMYKEDIIAAKFGTAYVYSKNKDSTWHISKLRPSGEKNAYYGHTVAIYGNYAIVGAYRDYPQEYRPGEAFIFERNAQKQWEFKTKLEAPVIKARDEFGYSVAIADGYAVVGAPGRDGGTVYIYQRGKNGQWALQQEILPLDSLERSERFGHAVAITPTGSQIIVGNPQQSDERGTAYVFTKYNHQWQQTNKLLASDARQRDSFGWSVAIAEQKIIIGAPQMRFRSGKVYVFKHQRLSQWTEQAILTHPDAYPNDFFGFSVALSKNQAVIGAARAKFEYSPDFWRIGGAAYVFQNKGDLWRLQDKLVPTEYVANGQFGWSVAIAGNFIAVGHRGYSVHRRPAAVFRNATRNIITTARHTRFLADTPTYAVRTFPNPVTDILKVQGFFQNESYLPYIIVDHQGKRVIKGVSKWQHHQLSIPVQLLKPGLYFLQVANQPKSYRFIKK